MLKNRIAKFAVTAAALAGMLAVAAAPASAATYIYQWSYSNLYSMPIVYRWVTSTQTAPTTQVRTTAAPTTTAAPAPVAKTTAAPAPTTTTTTSAGMTAEEQQMLNLINGERAKNGLAPLKADATLTKMARAKSQDMINNRYFAHQSPTYGSPFDMMKTFGVTYRTAGENIAGNGSVQGAFQAWMNSSGHRANILNGQFNTTGIGIVHGGQYGIMFTQEFVGR